MSNGIKTHAVLIIQSVSRKSCTKRLFSNFRKEIFSIDKLCVTLALEDRGQKKSNLHVLNCNSCICVSI